MSGPTISIVIPTHNRRRLLEEMLGALGQQTFPMETVEVIVVLDGCTDGTLEMLNGLKTPYTLRPIPQAQGGPSAARNNGARLALGTVIVFMDDDLLPEQQFLQAHADVHAHDAAALVLGRFLPEPGARKRGWHIWEERIFEKHYRFMASGKRPPAGRRLYSGNFSVGKQHFLAAGGFDESLKRGEDVELGFRLERAGLQFHFAPQAAAVHRGFRSFESWCTSSYLYGRTDVQLARQRGHEQVLPEIRRWFHRLPPPARLAVQSMLKSPNARPTATAALRAASGCLTAVHLHRLAHAGYSSIYKFQYWQGVADELGGETAFRKTISQPNSGQMTEQSAR